MSYVRFAHEEHQGIVKTKYRIRGKVWWPEMDKDVEKFRRVCHGFQVTSGFDPPRADVPRFSSKCSLADSGADLLGPLPTRERVFWW